MELRKGPAAAHRVRSSSVGMLHQVGMLWAAGDSRASGGRVLTMRGTAPWDPGKKTRAGPVAVTRSAKSPGDRTALQWEAGSRSSQQAKPWQGWQGARAGQHACLRGGDWAPKPGNMGCTSRGPRWGSSQVFPTTRVSSQRRDSRSPSITILEQTWSAGRQTLRCVVWKRLQRRIAEQDGYSPLMYSGVWQASYEGCQNCIESQVISLDLPRPQLLGMSSEQWKYTCTTTVASSFTLYFPAIASPKVPSSLVRASCKHIQYTQLIFIH